MVAVPAARLPVREVFPIRIAGLDKVGPVAVDLLGKTVVSLGFGAPAAGQGVENIPQFSRMERAGIIPQQLAVKVIDISRRAAQFCILQAPVDTAIIQLGMSAAHRHLRRLSQVVAAGTDHIRDVRAIAVFDDLVVSLLQQIPVDDRRKGQPGSGTETFRHHPLHCLHHLFRRQCTHFLQGIGAGQLGEHFSLFDCVRHRLIPKDAGLISAGRLHDRACHQVTRQRRREQRLDAHCTGGLAKDGNPVGVAAKCFDIFLHPFERSNLVKDAIVAAASVGVLFCQLRVAQKSKCTQPVVDRDQNHAFACKRFAVKLQLGPEPVNQCPTVNPEGNRQFLTGQRAPDIQIQTVLIHRRHKGRIGIKLAGIVDSLAVNWRLLHHLPGTVREVTGFQYPCPRLKRLRRFPPKVADRRLCIGNAKISKTGVLTFAAQITVFGMNQLHPSSSFLSCQELRSSTSHYSTLAPKRTELFCKFSTVIFRIEPQKLSGMFGQSPNCLINSAIFLTKCF